MTDTRTGTSRGFSSTLGALGNKLKSDESLLRAYRHGDSHAFEVLYLRHKDTLFAFIFRGCAQGMVAEELAHDTWLAVINTEGATDGPAKSNTGFAARAKFKTWLFGIAQHKVADHWRKRANREQHDALEDVVDSETARVSAAAQNPEAQRLWQELLRLIEALPEEQRISFLLREEGFSHTEIAGMTGVGRETVKSRLRYATRGLQTMLEDGV